jgi:dihydroflavonol-4-reductase
MILITGGTGLLGGHLTYRLLEMENQVRLLVRSEESKSKLQKLFSYYTNTPGTLLEKIEWVFGDILDKSVIENSFNGVDRVYHCAAAVSFEPRNKRAMLDTNIRGTANIVNACLESGIKKLVYVSSIAAIKGTTDKDYATENDNWPSGNRLNYQYSKTQAEFEVWRGINEGLSAVIVNPSVILGPGQWNSGSSVFFPTVFKGLNYYTKGVTGFVDVTDVAEVMIELMESGIQGERFIVSAENLSYEDIFNLIADSLEVKRPSKYVSRTLTDIAWKIDYIRSKLFFSNPFLTKETARASHTIQQYSSDKIKQAIGFSFKPLSQSIKRIASQFKNDWSKEIQN